MGEIGQKYVCHGCLQEKEIVLLHKPPDSADYRPYCAACAFEVCFNYTQETRNFIAYMMHGYCEPVVSSEIPLKDRLVNAPEFKEGLGWAHYLVDEGAAAWPAPTPAEPGAEPENPPEEPQKNLEAEDGHSSDNRS